MNNQVITWILDGKSLQAMTWLENEIEENEFADSDHYFYLLGIYQNLGKDAKYERLCQYIIDSDLFPQEHFYYEYSMYLLSKEDYDGALNVLNIGLDNFPEEADLFYGMAYVWYMMDDRPARYNHLKAWTLLQSAFYYQYEGMIDCSYYFLKAKIGVQLEKFEEVLADLEWIQQEYTDEINNKVYLAAMGDVIRADPERYRGAPEYYQAAIELGYQHCTDDFEAATKDAIHESLEWIRMTCTEAKAKLMHTNPEMFDYEALTKDKALLLDNFKALNLFILNHQDNRYR